MSPLQRDGKCHGGTENLVGRQKKDHGKSWPDEVTREKTWMEYWREQGWGLGEVGVQKEQRGVI